MKHYENVTLYTGNNVVKWATFTARFSRTIFPPLKLWEKEFDPENKEVELTKPTARENAFLNKHVVEYGDNSVMEMAPVMFYIENISILLGILLTDLRYGWSPMERSTRRQKMNPPATRFKMDKSSEDSWKAYSDAYDEKFAFIQKENPSWEKEDIRDATCDEIRHLVPLDAHTVIGITCNARSFIQMFHNLKHHCFINLPEDHAVFAEMDALRGNLERMFVENYAPFMRKIDPDHDTSIFDDHASIMFSEMKIFIKTHACVSLTLLGDFNPLPSCNVLRKNRHCVTPVLMHTLFVSGEIYSSVSIYREFKRHRTCVCYDVHFVETSALTLGTPAMWKFTTSLGHLMEMMELRTEYKTHVDYQMLCESILGQMKSKGVDLEELHKVFHFVYNDNQ